MAYKIDAKKLIEKLQKYIDEANGNSFDIVMEVSEVSVGYGMAEHDETIAILYTKGLKYSPHKKEEKLLGPKGFDYLIDDDDDEDDEK